MGFASNLNLALNTTRKGYRSFAKYRAEKASEAYDALSNAAQTYGTHADKVLEKAVDKAHDFQKDASKQAGAVTKAARVRLEKAKAAAEDNSARLIKEAQKSGKKLNRKTRKQVAKLERKAKKNDSHWVRNLTIAALTASGVAAAVYAVINKRNETPGTTPPRVEDQTTESPKLVYSTETGDKSAVELAEEGLQDLAAEAEATETDAATEKED